MRGELELGKTIGKGFMRMYRNGYGCERINEAERERGREWWGGTCEKL